VLTCSALNLRKKGRRNSREVLARMGCAEFSQKIGRAKGEKGERGKRAKASV